MTSFHTTSTPSSVSMAKYALSMPGTLRWFTFRTKQVNNLRVSEFTHRVTGSFTNPPVIYLFPTFLPASTWAFLQNLWLILTLLFLILCGSSSCRRGRHGHRGWQWRHSLPCGRGCHGLRLPVLAGVRGLFALSLRHVLGRQAQQPAVKHKRTKHSISSTVHDTASLSADLNKARNNTSRCNIIYRIKVFNPETFAGKH